LPRAVPVAVFALMAYDAADGRGIENNLRPGKGGHAGGFGEPLVVADKRRQAAEFGFVDFIITGALFKVIFFVEKPVLRDMDFMIGRQEFPLFVYNRRAIVIASVFLFKDRRSDDNTECTLHAG